MSFFTDIVIFGVDIWIILLGSIILRIIFMRVVFKNNTKQHSHSGTSMYPGSTPSQPICPNCGVSGYKDAKFCEQCGNRLDNQQKQSFQ